MIDIQNLHVTTEDKNILKGVNLSIKAGEIHAIMGPNGAGKSTLAKAIAGHPFYEVTEGDIRLNEESLLELEPDERAHLGIFMGFQYPVEMSGVSNVQLLKTALNTRRKKQGEKGLSDEEFRGLLSKKMQEMHIPEDFETRSVNEGFSGGEKKRNEILQMAVLDPQFAVLDETDSGLDIDAMRVVAEGVNHFMNQKKSLLLITHYQRLLDYIKPHFVHVMVDGKIVSSGGPELALKLEEKGYEWVESSC